MLILKNNYKKYISIYNCIILLTINTNNCTLSFFLCFLSMFFLVDRKKRSTFVLSNFNKNPKNLNLMSKINQKKTPKLLIKTVKQTINVI
jgi:hypothetical protein